MEYLRVFKSDKLKPNIKLLILASILVHLSLIKIDWGFISLPKIAKQPQPTEVRFIDIAELEKLKRSMPKQIVRTDQSGENRKSPDAKFLGKSDQSFKKQTVAKKIDTYRKGGRGNSTRTNATNGNAKKIAKNTAKKSAKSKKVAQAKKRLKLSDLGTVGMAVPAKQQKSEVAPQAKRQVAGTKAGDIRGKGIAASNDFVEDVELGDISQLNTVEYKYYGFYERIRAKLEQYWGNSLRERALAYFKSGRRLPAGENLITALTIFLNDQGEITKVILNGTSGLRILDEVAIDSFNQAGPFPNPPKGMVKEGVAKIQWNFVVKS